jgi:hypothetical protein
MACAHGNVIDERCGQCAKQASAPVYTTASATLYGWTWSYLTKLLDLGCVCGHKDSATCPLHRKRPARPDRSLVRALSLAHRMRTRAA